MISDKIIDKYLTKARKEINFSYKGYDVSMTITVDGGSCRIFKSSKLQDELSFSYFTPPKDRLGAMEQSMYTMLSIMDTIESTIKYNESEYENENR